MDDATILMLRELLDTGELVFSRDVEPKSRYDGHWYAWDEAHEDAELAYDAWRHARGRDAYAVYLAAQDRADAAQDALARYAPTTMAECN